MIKQNQRYSGFIDFSRYINIKPIKYIPPMIKMNPPPYYLKSFIQYHQILKLRTLKGLFF